MPTLNVSVVTNGAGRVGAAICKALASRGDLVVLVDADEQAAEDTRIEIVAGNGACLLAIGDVTDPESAAVVLKQALKLGDGNIDVLVNNVADVHHPDTPFAEAATGAWREFHDAGLAPVFTMTHALLPAMRETGAGRIVNVTTATAVGDNPGQALFAAYQAGVVSLTKSLASELADAGVRVNGVAADLDEPGRAARVVDFLTSAASTGLTGQTLRVTD